MGSGLPIILGIFFVFAVLGFAAYRRRQAYNAWREFALSNDLSFGASNWFGGFTLNGEFQGESIRVRTVTRGGRKNRKTYTVYSVSLPSSVPMGLVMYDESLFSKLGKFFGGQDIQVGRPQLDDAFIIKGNDPGRIRNFLDNDMVAAALLNLYAVESDLHLDVGTLTIEHRGYANSVHELQSHLEPLVDTAYALQDAGSGRTTAEDPARSEEEDAGEPADVEEPVAQW